MGQPDIEMTLNHSGGIKEVSCFLKLDELYQSSDPFPEARYLRSGASRGSAFSLEKAFSMGLNSRL